MQTTSSLINFCVFKPQLNVKFVMFMMRFLSCLIYQQCHTCIVFIWTVFFYKNYYFHIDAIIRGCLQSSHFLTYVPQCYVMIFEVVEVRRWLFFNNWWKFLVTRSEIVFTWNCFSQKQKLLCIDETYFWKTFCKSVVLEDYYYTIYKHV